MPLFECPMGFIGASEACVPLFECPMGFVGASEACVPLFECPMGFVGASEACESSQRLERSACDRTGLVSWLVLAGVYLGQDKDKDNADLSEVEALQI